MAYIQTSTNAKGETVYKIKVSCGYDIDGKQVTKTLTYKPEKGMTARQIEKEVNRQATLFEEKIKNGDVANRKVKFAQLANEWLEDVERKGLLKTSTIELYKGMRERTYKTIGHLYMDKITRKHIQDFIDCLAEGKDGKRALSEKSQKNYICFITDVFNYAIDEQVIKQSPCSTVKANHTEKKEREIYTIEEEATLFDRLQEREAPLTYIVFYLLLMVLGLRKGEALAIEWSDIDFEKRSVFIHRNSLYRNSSTGVYTTTPKTNGSVRCLELSQDILDLLPILKAEQESNKEKCGDLWIDSDRVFCNWQGKPIFPSQPYNYLKKFCEREQLPFKALHSFRHTMITNSIYSGEDIITTSARAGHNTPLCTLGIYSHDIKKQRAISCTAMSDQLSNARKKLKNNEPVMSQRSA